MQTNQMNNQLPLQNYEPISISEGKIEYEFIERNSNKLNIFF